MYAQRRHSRTATILTPTHFSFTEIDFLSLLCVCVSCVCSEGVSPTRGMGRSGTTTPTKKGLLSSIMANMGLSGGSMSAKGGAGGIGDEEKLPILKGVKGSSVEGSGNNSFVTAFQVGCCAWQTSSVRMFQHQLHGLFRYALT